jgi:hypothetical protein
MIIIQRCGSLFILSQLFLGCTTTPTLCRHAWLWWSVKTRRVQVRFDQIQDLFTAAVAKVGGIERNCLTAIGYGETRPVANNETKLGRKSNRRIEILIINE